MDVIYSETAVNPIYKAYVQKFWTLNNLSNPFHTPAKFALPNGCCTIAFISGNGISLSYENKVVELPRGVYLSGQATKRVGISLNPHTKAVMAQVKPWLPPLLSNIPMNELADTALSLEYFNKGLYQRLTSIDLANETTLVPEFYKCLNAYLNSNTDSFFVQWAFRKLLENNISDLAGASGYSQRRVEQKFKALVGPTAKEIQRILQLRRIIDEMHQLKNERNFSELANRHGYYDQSHFIKSYQRIISEAPSQFDTADYLLPISGHFDFLQS